MLVAALVSTVAGVAATIALAGGGFALGGALLALSVAALRWPFSVWRAEPPQDLAPGTRRAALLAVCAVAVFFRVYRLDQPGLWGDDAINGLLAFDILDGKVHSPFQIVSHSHSNFHALSNYPIAAAFALFGPDLWTLRLPGIVFGILCVPLLYGIAAPLFGARVALLAALFFASSPPQITHAKQLIQIELGLFFQLAGLCLLVRGLAARRRWMVAAAALPLAGCVYTYHAARLAPLVGVVYAVAVLVHAGPAQAGIARARPGSASAGGTPASAAAASLGSALVVFAIALAPAVIGYVQDPAALTGRVEATSLLPVLRATGSLRPLWDSAWRTLLMFHYEQGPEYHWFGLGFDPAFNVVLGFLFVHGLVASLGAWRQPRHLLLLAWAAIGLVPGILSSGAPRLYRALLATPPLYVWAALPVARLAAAAAGSRWRRPLRAWAALLVLAIPLIDFNYYFYRVYTHPVFSWFQGERLVEMARTLRGYGPGWTGYLLADNFDVRHETFGFLARAWGLTIQDVASLVDVLPLRDQRARGALFMMSEADVGAAAAIRARYPGGEWQERREPTLRSWWGDAWWRIAPWNDAPRLTAAFYAVPAATIAAPHDRPPPGLIAEYDFGDQHLTRAEPYPFYYFFPPTFPRRFTVRWRGRLHVPDPGGYQFDVESGGRAIVWLDGRPARTREPVPAGVHDFALEVRDVPGRARLRIYWMPPGGDRALVPPEAWSPPP